jgi:hypothetical protein
MVKAAMNKRSSQEVKSKKGDKLAKPECKMLCWLSKNHKNKPFTIKKRAIAKYPVKDPKNKCNSFFNKAYIKYQIIKLG